MKAVSKEAGRSDTMGLFLQFPKASQSLEKGWFKLCNVRHEQIVTVRRKPAVLIGWWRSSVNTGVNSQDGIPMFYLCMQICMDMKIERKKISKI